MRRKGKRQGDAVPLNPLPKGMIPFGILGKRTDLDLGAAVPGGGPGAASGFGGNWMPGGETSGDAVPLNPLPKGMIPFGILGKCTDLDLGTAVPGGGPGAASGFGGDWMPGGKRRGTPSP